MTNVRQKPIAALAFKRGGRGVVPVLPAPPDIAPAPPDGLTEYALGAWEEFWQTDVSGAVNMKRDGEHLREWARLVDARRALWQVWEEVRSYRDKAVIWRQIKDMSAEITRAEQIFGMTPLYKMRLTGALDQAEAAEQSIKTRRDRRPVEA
jgi:hypothetical protein